MLFTLFALNATSDPLVLALAYSAVNCEWVLTRANAMPLPSQGQHCCGRVGVSHISHYSAIRCRC